MRLLNIMTRSDDGSEFVGATQLCNENGDLELNRQNEQTNMTN